MAASITIIRSLKEQGGDVDAPLVSAFTTNSIEFKFNREANTGTYAKVEINGIAFFATMVEVDFETTTDRYIIDLTNILPSFLDLNDVDIDYLAPLSSVIEIDIKGYSSAGVLLATNTSHADIELSFGYPPIASGGGLDRVYEIGRQGDRSVYTNGVLSFYNSGAAGTYDLTMDAGDTSESVVLVNGFNYITLTGNLLKSGTLTHVTAVLDLNIKVVYRAAKSTEVPVIWLDRDGCWARWYFRLISTNNDVQRSKEVPIYAYTNATQKGRTREIGAAKSIDFLFDTLAVNAEHYKILTEIKESPLVVYDGRIVKVADSSSETAECKQNLRFTITLKMQENVVSY